MTVRVAPSLEKRLGDAIKSGGKIIVVGWITSNHCTVTKELEESGQVRFVKGTPDQVAANDFVMCTRFTCHVDTDKARRNKKHCEIKLLNTGTIRKALRAVAPLIRERIAHKRAALELEIKPLPPKRQLSSVSSVLSAETNLKGGLNPMSSLSIPPIPPLRIASQPPRLTGTAPQATVTPSPVLPVILTPSQPASPTKPAEQDPIQAFADDFADAVGYNPDDKISKYKLSDLLKKHFGEGVRANSSQVAGLLRPLVKEGGQKVGSYRASPALIEKMPSVKPASSSSAPLTAEQKARQLVAREPEIRAELENIEVRKVHLNDELTRVEKAREALKNLESI